MNRSDHPRDLALRISVYSGGMFIAGWALRGELIDGHQDVLGWFVVPLFWSIIISDAFDLKKKALEGCRRFQKTPERI